jgi:hypothetical protein
MHCNIHLNSCAQAKARSGSLRALRSLNLIGLGLLASALCGPIAATGHAQTQGPNGHYYDYFLAPGILWDDAKAATETQTFGCLQGHLATITSLDEDVFLENLRQQFVVQSGLSAGGVYEFWAGGFQLRDQATPGDGWFWVNNEGPISGVNSGPGFANWGAGEPNDCSGIEANVENQLALGRFSALGWNDEGCAPGFIFGYVVEYEDSEAPIASCQPTTNPSGKNVPAAGQNGGSGQNPDGFYQLLASDNCDSSPGIYVQDSASSFVAGPFANGDKVKITQAPGATPNQKPGAGVIVAHIQLKGDALVYAVDSAGNISELHMCLLPPK